MSRPCPTLALPDGFNGHTVTLCHEPVSVMELDGTVLLQAAGRHGRRWARLSDPCTACGATVADHLTTARTLWRHEYQDPSSRDTAVRGRDRLATATRQPDGSVRVVVEGVMAADTSRLHVLSDATLTAEQFAQYEPVMLAGIAACPKAVLP